MILKERLRRVEGESSKGTNGFVAFRVVISFGLYQVTGWVKKFLYQLVVGTVERRRTRCFRDPEDRYKVV